MAKERNSVRTLYRQATLLSAPRLHVNDSPEAKLNDNEVHTLLKKVYTKIIERPEKP